jgi:1-aminocyclopropane-1-carboxylate deaminase/D-cysteine desulfhydrase-like pyridoxal-dependent ACC family enzyme
MGNDLDNLLLAEAEKLRQAGRKPFCWDRVTGRPIAAVSYALCLAEIMEQMRTLGVTPTAVYASAAGATGAGLALGKAALGWKGAVRLIAPIRWPWDTAADMAEVSNQTATLLGLPHRLAKSDIDVRDDFIGSAYGVVTPGSREAMDLLARSEGILLDPVYTGKAMAGLIADVRSGRLGPKDVAVFIHTGGTPAVFAYRDELLGRA